MQHDYELILIPQILLLRVAPRLDRNLMQQCYIRNTICNIISTICVLFYIPGRCLQVMTAGLMEGFGSTLHVMALFLQRSKKMGCFFF